MKQINTRALRETTVRHWASFYHARHEVDVQRVHAFQALTRENADLSLVTDDQVTEAYGGRGWAPTPTCYECGARSDANVLFGGGHDISLCQACIDRAKALTVEPPTPGFFTRLFRKGA